MTLLPETERALRHRLATAQVQGRAPSVAAVVRDGRPQWMEGRGGVDGAEPDGDVQYRIGSITKVFAAVLVLRLRDEGLLTLADPLATYLPDAPAGQATVGALLAHTAGLAADPPGPWWERTDGTARPQPADIAQVHPAMPGFVATVWVSPDDDLAAVVLANLTAGLPVGALAADLLHTVAEREPRIPAAWCPLTAVDPELLELAGPWYKGPAPFVLRPLAGGFLELTPLSATARGTRMRPTGDGEWEGLNGYFAGERLRLVRHATGAVNHLDLASYIFTRQPYDPAAPVPGGVDPAGWRTG